MYREKLNILNEIDTKYEITPNLKDEIKKLIKFESHKSNSDVKNF